MRILVLAVMFLVPDAAIADCSAEIDGMEVGGGIKRAMRCLNQLHLDTVAANVSIPEGSIVAWDPAVRNEDGSETGRLRPIPAGWQSCNGKNSTINLDKRFLYGVDSPIAVGTTGGSSIIPAAEAHSHDGKTKSAGPVERLIPCDGNCYGRYTDHNHTFTTSPSGAHDHGGDKLPPYVTVMFLCRT